MHPCFVRGNKELCCRMSRHNLPSAEMYSQAFSANTNQLILNQPDQLVTDRSSQWSDETDVAKSADWSRLQNMMKSIEPVDTSKRVQNEGLKKPTPIAAHITNSTMKTPETGTETKMEELLSLDNEEDWSLLSECLDRVLNPSRSVDTLSDVLTGKSKTSKGGTASQYLPLEALPEGMAEPATPETVEYLFTELSGW